MKKNFLLALAVILAFPIGVAIAGGNELAYFKVQELPTLSAASVASGDFVPVYDISAGKVKKVAASGLPFVGATPGAGAFTTLSATGTITYDDGTGASPSVVYTDGTDETATWSKVDAGFLTLTTTAGDGLNVLTGNLKVGNGTPGVTQDGEDAYVEGTFEVDGAQQFDGAAVFNGNATLNADVIGDGTDQMYGFLQDQVASTTVSATLAQCGKTFVNDSADVITLPEASTALGCRYTFVCGNASNFDINPADGTDTIGTVASVTGANTTTLLAPSAGDAVRCAAVGASLVLEATGANAWTSIGLANGTWTDVN